MVKTNDKLAQQVNLGNIGGPEFVIVIGLNYQLLGCFSTSPPASVGSAWWGLVVLALLMIRSWLNNVPPPLSVQLVVYLLQLGAPPPVIGEVVVVHQVGWSTIRNHQEASIAIGLKVYSYFILL